MPPPPVPDRKDNSPHTAGPPHPRLQGCPASCPQVLISKQPLNTDCVPGSVLGGERTGVVVPPGCPCGEIGRGRGGSALRTICSGGLEVLGGPWRAS